MLPYYTQRTNFRHIGILIKAIELVSFQKEWSVFPTLFSFVSNFNDIFKHDRYFEQAYKIDFCESRQICFWATCTSWGLNNLPFWKQLKMYFFKNKKYSELEKNYIMYLVSKYCPEFFRILELVVHTKKRQTIFMCFYVDR